MASCGALGTESKAIAVLRPNTRSTGTRNGKATKIQRSTVQPAEIDKRPRLQSGFALEIPICQGDSVRSRCANRPSIVEGGEPRVKSACDTRRRLCRP